jgi:hypothetical protein
VNVAAGDGVVVWQGYNFGELRVQSVGGDDKRTLFTSEEEQLTEDVLVHAGHAYWTSKAQHGLFRVPLAGGPPERLVDTGQDGPTQLARVGDAIYVRTFEKVVYRWSPDSGAKSIVTSQAEPALAVRDSQLYLGREFDIAATLDLAKDPPHQVAVTQGRVMGIALTASMLYWIEADASRGEDVLWRQGRSGGDPGMVLVPPGMKWALTPTDQGVFLGVDDAVLWIDDRAGRSVEVAQFAEGESPTSIAVLGESVFVATSTGNVYQRCFTAPDPASSGM